MAERQVAPLPADVLGREPIVNDFSIVAATVNGSGSQTANATLIRALFWMGIPVNGKNLFPSNIAGLPTWYTIRVSKDGYIARREGTEILVAYNQKTVADDLAGLPSGAVCVYPNDLKFEKTREDITYYPIPVKELVKASGAEPRLRDYIASMTYVGALAELLGIELELIREALNKHFKGRAKPVQLNYGVITSAAEWVRQNLEKRDPYRVERMDKNRGQIVIDGNTAAALGALFNGMTVASWYPITPATSLADELEAYAKQLRRGEDGAPTYAIIQAEDELAAAGMVFGAGWAGARAMTSTSGPGISLMTEFVGLGYFAEIPGVIWDIQRMGPSTGLPTRVSQGDVIATYFLGHGDTRHVVLFPGSVAECFEFAGTAFDLAEQLQTPVFVLSDLDLGMNLWMTEPFAYPEQPMQRGKVLTAEELERLESWARYKDEDGTGVGPRTLPGTDHPNAASFPRGTGHTENAVYSERPADWRANMERLARKHEYARRLVPKPVVDERPGAEIGIIAFGSADPAVVEGRDRLRKQGVETSYLRLRALPIEETLRDFIARHDWVYVIELNHDGQLCHILRMELPEHATRLVSLAHSDGLPLTAHWITQAITEQER
ncbi:MAG TPA: 2-oxoacid:acceptor oxidoreductase subunit alpha [Ardenticatenaceae bacterium]|nr:2-oxoacid:acceptor oxidoreductase subunit alpha [Ardenticatenaceae bacterium]